MEEVKQAVRQVRAAVQGNAQALDQRGSKGTVQVGSAASRTIIGQPEVAYPLIEKHMGYQTLGDYGGRVALNHWTGTSAFWEFQLADMIYNPTAGAAAIIGHVPQQGPGRSNRIGDQIYIDNLQFRICVEGESYNGTATVPMCCRMLCIQVLEETADVAARGFTLNDFFITNNITSYAKSKQERLETSTNTQAYKVLLDKTFTLGGAENPFTDKRMHLSYKLGMQMFTSANTTNEMETRPGRIIWGMFCEEPNSTLRPSFYGDWRWYWRDL